MASASSVQVQTLINDSPMNGRRWGVVALCFVSRNQAIQLNR